MTVPTRIAALGPVMQLAFVPEDFDATLNFWVEKMGAGPFFILTGQLPDWQTHRGQPTCPDLTIALGHWGDMQIEIIAQHNDAPSTYKEWRDAGHEGLHHSCIVVDDIDHARRVCTRNGGQLLIEGGGAGAEWFYVDNGGGPGTILEVIRHSEQSGALMAMIRDAALDWDGADPIRHI
jgi:catechol 2,3-dioxygenase-like lactoylglutathione lyase family enzyme